MRAEGSFLYHTFKPYIQEDAQGVLGFYVCVK